MREHGEAEAVKLLDEGMEKLGLLPEQLEGMPKLSPGKQVLAAWIASQTLVGTEWIAGMLWMGHRSNVSAAKKWVRDTKEGRKWLLKLKEPAFQNCSPWRSNKPALRGVMAWVTNPQSTD